MQGDVVLAITDLLDRILDRARAMLGDRTEGGDDAAVTDPALGDLVGFRTCNR